jgi:hypothetical protein
MTTSLINICLNQIPGFANFISNECSETDTLKLCKHECVTENNQTYKVIKYDKNILCVDIIPTYGLCRSVIANKEDHVLCYSPPKSYPSDIFIKSYPDNPDNLDKKSHIIAQEYVEGTMINVFWDKNIGLNGAWEISTRNTVGAVSSFYKSKNSKTFRTMFLEAARENGFDLLCLNTNYCYSFVLQHPENRIVVPFKTPQLYLIAVYSINNSDKNNIIVTIENMKEIQNTQYFSFTKIKFPETYEYTTYLELIEKYASMNTPYHILGVVLYNEATGERTKIRNPVYEEVRQLRGNQPKLQYQYLSLRRTGEVSNFLNFYPEHKKEFSQFRDQVHLFTETLFNNYISCYIKKEKPLKEFSDQYRTHMFNLHQKYMNELREKKLSITKWLVIGYVNLIHPTLLMYCLNYNLRKRNVDFIKVESDV